MIGNARIEIDVIFASNLGTKQNFIFSASGRGYSGYGPMAYTRRSMGLTGPVFLIKDSAVKMIRPRRFKYYATMSNHVVPMQMQHPNNKLIGRFQPVVSLLSKTKRQDFTFEYE